MESTINDFWRMLWEHKSRAVVMLCGLMEDGKVDQNCYNVVVFWLLYGIVCIGELLSVLAKGSGLIRSVWKTQGEANLWRQVWWVCGSQVKHWRRYTIPCTSMWPVLILHEVCHMLGVCRVSLMVWSLHNFTTLNGQVWLHRLAQRQFSNWSTVSSKHRWEQEIMLSQCFAGTSYIIHKSKGSQPDCMVYVYIPVPTMLSYPPKISKLCLIIKLQKIFVDVNGLV